MRARRARASAARSGTGQKLRAIAWGRVAKQGLGKEDRTRPARRLGPDRQAVRSREGQVALDAEPERQGHAGDFGQTETAKLGTTEAEIGEPEQRVFVVIEFGREPCRRTE